jgi:hypothetical protein
MLNITRMTKGKGAVISALSVLIFISVISCTVQGHHYKITTFKSENGWGYDVVHNGKVYIHQPFMPVIEGNVPFEKRKYAREAAKIVVKKLRENKPPSITMEELKSITGKSAP